MGSFLDEPPASLLQQDAGFRQALEQLMVEPLIAITSMERLRARLLPRCTRLDEHRAHVRRRHEVLNRLGDELQTVVAEQVVRRAVQGHEALASLDRADRPAASRCGHKQANHRVFVSAVKIVSDSVPSAVASNRTLTGHSSCGVSAR